MTSNDEYLAARPYASNTIHYIFLSRYIYYSFVSRSPVTKVILSILYYLTMAFLALIISNLYNFVPVNGVRHRMNMAYIWDYFHWLKLTKYKYINKINSWFLNIQHESHRFPHNRDHVKMNWRVASRQKIVKEISSQSWNSQGMEKGQGTLNEHVRNGMWDLT